MSKPPTSAKPRASEPARLPSNPPPNARKASSGPNGAAGRSPSKFYDGPTVQKKAVEVKEQAKVVAGNTVAVAKSKSRKAVRVVKRHPLSIASLITTIPALIFFSLFSTVLCPPPDSQPTGISRFVQSRLGTYVGPSELRQTLCYPANQYHDSVLVPYVYPAVEELKVRAEGTVGYQKVLHPGYVFARDTGSKYWEHPIRPIVNRVTKAARKVYMITIEPHLPWLRTKFYTLTAPIYDRLSATHQQYLAPHLSTASRHAGVAHGKALGGYRYVAAHPISALLGRHASTGYRVGSKRAGEAYTWSRPHAFRIAREAERVTREVVVPKATAALKWVVDHIEEGFYIVKGQVTTQYNTHLDPHLHPYTSQVSATLAPYTRTFVQKIYNPYLRQHAHHFLPAALLAPTPPKSFWTIISDILPSPGSHAAQRKGSFSDDIRKGTASAKASASATSASVKQQAAKASSAAQDKASSLSVAASKSASSAASVASQSASSVSAAAKQQVTSATSAGRQVAEEATASAKSASNVGSASVGSVASSASGTAAQQGKMTKEEFEAKRDAIAANLKKVGDSSLENLKKELIGVQTRFFENTFPKMADNNRQELSKDVDYILSGLDKLYSESEALTRNQVKQSGVMGEQRLQNKLATIKARGGEVARVTKDQGKPALRKEMDRVDAVLGKDWTDLAMKIALIDDMTPKDRKAFNALRKTADEYKTRLAALHEGKELDKSVQAAESKLSVAIKELTTELDDLYAGFRERVKILQNSANDKIAAREMVRGSQAARSAASVKEGQATILPIIPGAVAADVGGEINSNDLLGKGKEQILSALSQASAAVQRETTAAGVADQVAASASSVYSQASSGVHDATRSAARAVGVTPSPESPAEHPQSVLSAARASAESVASVASSAVHHATRSVISAAGATPSPETYGETAESVYAAASKSAASVVSAAGDSATDATDAIKSAMSSLHGATESIKSKRSPIASANEYIASAANDVAAGAASVYGVAEEKVHQATRSVISAVGATPSPETPGEYVQSYAGEIGESASSFASVVSASASSAGSVVSSAVHKGTRAAIKAVGATPSPESAQEHFDAYKAVAADNLGSILADVQASASSVAGAVSTAVHHATRSVVSAAGGTPAPETPGETLQSVVAAASASAASVYDAAASAGSDSLEQLSSLAGSIQSVLLGQGANAQPTPLASTASAYLASVSAAGASAGAEAYASGVSILASLQSQAAEQGRAAVDVGKRAKEAVVGKDEL